MKTPESNLAALRASWEKELGLESIAEFGAEDVDHLVVVCKDNDPELHEHERFSVLRYIVVGSQWVVSGEAQMASAEEALRVAAKNVKPMTNLLSAVIPR